MESPVNFLTLHRDPNRQQYFSDVKSQKPFFDSTLKAWIVTNPSHCKELIASSNLRPDSYVENYDALEKRLGIDFSILTFAFNHIPLCLHGDRHLHARRRVSEFLATRKALLSARVPVAVATHFDVMRREGRVELMRDAVLPFVLDIISTIIGIDLSAMDRLNASLLFDKSIGMHKRRRIAAEIAALRELISSHSGGEIAEDDVGLRLALLILGKDTLIGTLGESLYRLLADNSTRRLADIAYPDLPPETGVPIMERLVVTPFRLAGCKFAVGERVRIFLQSFAYADEPRIRTSFWGGGAHTCLGRPLSIEIWTAIIELMSKVPLRATVLSYATRDSDYIFTCPERLQVELRQ